MRHAPKVTGRVDCKTVIPCNGNPVDSTGNWESRQTNLIRAVPAGEAAGVGTRHLPGLLNPSAYIDTALFVCDEKLTCCKEVKTTLTFACILFCLHANVICHRVTSQSGCLTLRIKEEMLVRLLAHTAIVMTARPRLHAHPAVHRVPPLQACENGELSDFDGFTNILGGEQGVQRFKKWVQLRMDIPWTLIMKQSINKAVGNKRLFSYEIMFPELFGGNTIDIKLVEENVEKYFNVTLEALRLDEKRLREEFEPVISDQYVDPRLFAPPRNPESPFEEYTAAERLTQAVVDYWRLETKRYLMRFEQDILATCSNLDLPFSLDRDLDDDNGRFPNGLQLSLGDVYLPNDLSSALRRLHSLETGEEQEDRYVKADFLEFMLLGRQPVQVLPFWDALDSGVQMIKKMTFLRISE